MRRSFSLGLLALIASIFTSQVLASNAEVCDSLIKAKKGLHGLCVAWHNANEKNRGKIEDKFLSRAGYPITDIVGGGPDPEPDTEPSVECPCWTPEILASAVADFGGQFCVSVADLVENGEIIFKGYEAAIYVGNIPQVWAGATPFVNPEISESDTECRLGLADGSTVFVFDTDGDQDAVCREDVRSLQMSVDEQDLPVFPPCF